MKKIMLWAIVLLCMGMTFVQAQSSFSAYLDKTISYQLTGEYNRGGSISPDGSKIAVGGKEGLLKIFSVYDGSVLKTLSGHSSWVNGLAFSSDGTKLASGCSDKTVKIWDVNGGYALKTISDFTQDVIAVAYSPDGRYVAAGGFDKLVKIIDVSGGYVIKTLYGHNNSVWSLQFSPDGKYLMSGDSDGQIKVWSVASWYIEKSAFQAGWITSIRFTSDGQKAVTTSESNTVRVWSFPAMYEQKTMSHTGGVWMCAISPDNKYIASGGKDKVLRVWDINTGYSVTTQYGHSENIGVVLFASDGKKMITASDDNTVRLWNVSGVSSAGSSYSGGYSGSSQTGSFSAYSDKTVSYQLSGSYNRGGAITSDGSKFAVSGKDGLLKLFNTSDGSFIRQFSGHTSYVNGLAFSGDNTRIVSGSSDKTMKIWDVNGGYAVKTFYDFGNSVIAVAYSPDGKFVAGGGPENVVKVFDVNGGYLIKTLTGHNASIWGLQFSPDGKYLISGDSDGNIKVWNVSSWFIEKSAFQGGWVNSFRFTSDGTKMVSTSYNNTVRIWSFPAMYELKTMYHTNNAWMSAISPDDKYVVSCGRDMVLRVWDISTGNKAGELYGHSGNVGVVLFSSTGKRLVSAGDDNNIMLWTVSGVGGKSSSYSGYTGGYSSGGGEIVVAKDGSGSYSSVSSALISARSGDVIRVKAGTYYESGLTISQSGVKLTGDGPEKTIIDAGGKSPVLSISANNVTVSGFTWKNGSGLGGAIKFSNTNVTFTNNVVRDMNDYGIYSWDGTPTISNNIFYRCGGGEYSAEKDAIALNKSNAIIKNNIFYGNSCGSAVDNEGDASPVISYNIIHSSGQGLKRCYGGSGNLYSDPLLNTYSFTLNSGSPAIGSGENGTTIGISGASGYASTTGSVTGSGGSVSATLDKTISYQLFEDYTRGGVMFPDGSKFAVISGKTVLKVFNTSDGSLYKTYTGHNGWMNGVAVSKDGSKLASASSDKTAKIWSVTGGYVLKTFSDFTDHVMSVAFSPDGLYLAVSGYDKTIKIYDVNSGYLYKSLYGHSNSVWSLRYSNDGKYLLSGDDGGNIKLWNTSSWYAEKTAYHSGTVVHFTFTGDGQKLVSSSSGGSAKLWSFPAMSEQKTFTHTDKVWMSSVSPDDKYLFTACFDKTLKIWDLNSGTNLKSLYGHTNNVSVVLISQDGKKLVSAADDNTIRLWNVTGVTGTTGGYSGTYTTSQSGDDFDVTLSKTVSYLLTGEYNRGGAITVDGTKIAIGGKEGMLKMFSAYDGSLTKTLSGHTSWVNGLAFSPDNTKLLSGSSDKTMKIWDVSGGYAVKTFSDFNSDVIAVAYSPDGRYVAGGGFDKEVKVFEVSSGTLIKTLYGHSSSVWSLQFSPDGKYLMSGDSDGNIKVWSVSSWYLDKSAFQSGWITSIRFTSNSAKVVTTSYGNTVRIWSFPGMIEQKTMYHTDKVWMCSISPDESYVVSSGADKVIKIWDMNTGSNVKTLYGHTNTVGVVLFTSDGKKIISASDDNTIKLWNVSGVGGKSSGVYSQTSTGGSGSYGTAKTLTVAKDGSGSYSSVSSALAVAQYGDIIQVKAGTYYESGLNLNKSNVKLMGEGPGKTVIDAGGKSPVLSVSSANNSTVSGFTFKNTSGTGGGIKVSSSNITFSNNVVTDFQDYGMFIWDCSPVISNNIFYKTAGGEYSAEKDAIGLNKANAIIKNNIFYGNLGGSAIDNENNSYPTISYNIIHSSGQAFKRCYGGTGNSFSDPLLNTWDFTVQYGSPAIGKGEGGANIGLLTAKGALSSGTSTTGSSGYSGTVSASLHKTLYGHSGKVRGVGISPDGKWVASGDSEGKVFIWDAISGIQSRSLTGHTSWVNGLEFNSDGSRLATASSDKNVILWNVSSGSKIATLYGHTDLTITARFSNDGRYIATGSFDNTVKIWDAQSGSLVRTLSGHKNSVWSVAFNRDGTLLASGDTGDEIILWNTTTWNRVRSMKTGKSSNWVNGLVFSQDSKLLYAGNYDNSIVVWDVATGVTQKTFLGHTNHVWGVALSPDGKVLASASEDRTVKLWETSTGNLIKTLNEPKESLSNVSFSADGTKLTSGSDDKNVYVWNVTGISGSVQQYVYQSVQTLPPYLSSTALFSDANGDNLLSAGESGKITLTIKNTGKGPAQGVNAKFTITAGSLGMYVGMPSYYIGEIPAGTEKTISTTIDATDDVIDQKVSLKAEATEKNGFGADAVTINFNSKASDPPLLTINKYVIRDDGSGQSQGNGDGVIQKKETIEITVFIANGGKGTAGNVKTVLKSTDQSIMVSQSSADLGEIKPGEIKKGVFVFAVSGNYNDAIGGSSLPLALDINEKRTKFNRTENMNLSLGTDYKKEVVVDVASTLTTTSTDNTGMISTNLKDKVKAAVDRMNNEIGKMKTNIGDIELPTRDNVYAVIVGISDYKSKDVPQLNYAVNDAAGVYALLTNNLVGGLPASNVKFLKGEEASLTEVKVALGWLVNQGIDDENATLIFYYSGHGAPEQDDQGNVRTAYLIPYDGQPKFISETGISIDYLQQELGKVKAKNVFVALDACFTGSGRSFMKKGARGINIVPKEIIKAQGEGRIFITAAANDQSAFDFPEKEHGLFTNFLLEAMTGKADSDNETGNNDGWVTSTEVFNYLRDRVSKTARKNENVKQEPQMVGTGEVKLTRILQKESGSMTQDDKISKLKKAMNDGTINMNQYIKAVGQVKSGTENQVLKDYLSGKIDGKKFTESF